QHGSGGRRASLTPFSPAGHAGRTSGGRTHQLADSAKYAVEHGDKGIQFLRRGIAKQKLRETVLVSAHRLSDLDALGCQRYERRTAVSRVGGASHQPIRLEPVDETRDVARRDPQRPAQRALGDGAILLKLPDDMGALS